MKRFRRRQSHFRAFMGKNVWILRVYAVNAPEHNDYFYRTRRAHCPLHSLEAPMEFGDPPQSSLPRISPAISSRLTSISRSPLLHVWGGSYCGCQSFALGPDRALLGTRSLIIQPLRSTWHCCWVSTVQYPPTLLLHPDKAKRIAYHLTSR